MIYSKLTSLALAFLLGLQLAVAQPHRRRHNRREELVSQTKTVGSTGGGLVPRADKPGIVYTPYNNDGTCKSTSDVASDMASMNRLGFGQVRIYGIDCNQVSNVLNAAKPLGMRVFLGIFDMGQCESQLAQLIQSVAGNWYLVYAISIGNEEVNNGAMSAPAMVDKVNTSRTVLRAAGYAGPVVTVDTWVAIIANPALCQCSDIVMANCHPFFDGGVVPSTAGQFMSDSIAKLQAACGGKEVIIAETGWPHQGAANGKCIPGIQEQHDALTSIHEVLGSNAFYFTFVDDLWKHDSLATSNAEKYWGIEDFSTVTS